MEFNFLRRLLPLLPRTPKRRYDFTRHNSKRERVRRMRQILSGQLQVPDETRAATTAFFIKVTRDALKAKANAPTAS